MQSMRPAQFAAARVTMSHSRHRAALALTAAFIATLLVWSVHAAEPAISVSNPRIRLLPGNLPLAGYVDLTNTGKRPLTLTAASSPVFAVVEFHKTVEERGAVRMVAIKHFEIRPQETARFTPGSHHLMLLERSRPLKIGDEVPITFTFSSGDKLEVTFTVRSATTQ